MSAEKHNADTEIRDLRLAVAKSAAGTQITNRVLSPSSREEMVPTALPVAELHEQKLRTERDRIIQLIKVAEQTNTSVSSAITDTLSKIDAELDQIETAKRREQGDSEPQGLDLAEVFQLDDETNAEVAAILEEIFELEAEALAKVVHSMARHEQFFSTIALEARSQTVIEARKLLIDSFISLFFELAQRRQITNNLTKIAKSPQMALNISRSLLQKLNEAGLRQLEEMYRASTTYARFNTTYLDSESIDYDTMLAYGLCSGVMKNIDGVGPAIGLNTEWIKQSASYGLQAEVIQGYSYFALERLLKRYPELDRQLAIIQEVQLLNGGDRIFAPGIKSTYRLKPKDQESVQALLSQLEKFNPARLREYREAQDKVDRLTELSAKVAALPVPTDIVREFDARVTELTQEIAVISRRLAALPTQSHVGLWQVLNTKLIAAVTEANSLRNNLFLKRDELATLEAKKSEVAQDIYSQRLRLAEERAVILGLPLDRNDSQYEFSLLYDLNNHLESNLRNAQQRARALYQLLPTDLLKRSAELPVLPSGTNRTNSRALPSGQL